MKFDPFTYFIPSGEGPIVCSNCGGKGYVIYGPNPEFKFTMIKSCFDCDFKETTVNENSLFRNFHLKEKEKNL